MSNKHKQQKHSAHKQHRPQSGESKATVASGNPGAAPKSQVESLSAISSDATVTLRFSALDTWFFRESKPMESVGGSELASVFPPPPRTLLGAMRTAIGDAEGINWAEFRTRQPTHPCCSKIGTADDLGPLALTGPWLSDDNERLYPVPLFLLAKTEANITCFARLCIGKPVCTYMGRVRLPELPDAQRGAKPLEQAWITQAGLETILNGDVPAKIIKSTTDKDCRQAKPAVKAKKAAREVIRYAKDLFKSEPRLGIARDNATRTVLDGMLYQTQHIRPEATLTIEADLTLPKGTQLADRIMRLGAEGRLAHVGVAKVPQFPKAPVIKDRKDIKGIILILLTPARFVAEINGTNTDNTWLPPGFSAIVGNDGIQTWQGTINGIALTLHAAVIGKVRREGGWDTVHHQSRPMRSFIPAGSAYYMTVDDGKIQAAITGLHHQTIGADQALGRGLLACGLWCKSEFSV